MGLVRVCIRLTSSGLWMGVIKVFFSREDGECLAQL